MIHFLQYDDRLGRVLADVFDHSMFVVLVHDSFLNLIRRDVSTAYSGHVIPVIVVLHVAPLLRRRRV